MRLRGKPEFKAADLFMDFKGIQVTLAVMAQALIDGRIDCKTAGRLAVGLQTASKLLWMMHRKGREGRKGNQISPQIFADERRSSQREELPELFVLPKSLEINAGKNWGETSSFKSKQGEETRIALVAELSAFADGRGAPPEVRTGQGAKRFGIAAIAKTADIVAIRRAEKADSYGERVHGPPEWVRAA
jgi:hypothetical protein